MFQFEIDQPVRVKGIGIVGIVDSLSLNRGDVKMASVEYLDLRGRVQCGWFEECRLESHTVDPARPTN